MVRRLPPTLLSLLFLLELPFLGRRPLARDEVVSTEVAHRTYHALWDALGQIDAALGLYYALLHPFLAVSDTAFAARLPSLLGMVVAAALLIRTATDRWGRRAGAFTGLLLLGNPVTWEFANIVRPYALALALAAGTLHLVLLSRRRPVLLGVLALLLLYTQSLFVLLLLVELVVLARRRQWRLVGALTAAVVAWLPLLVVIIQQRRETAWIPYTSPVAAAEQVHEFFGSDGLLSAVALLVWGAVMALGVRRHEVRRLLLAAALPAALLALLGLRLHLFGTRYLLWTVLVIALAGGLSLARSSSPRLVAALSVALVLLAVASVVREATIPYRLEDLPAASAYIAAHDRPGDAVLFSPDWARTSALPSLDSTPGVHVRDIALKHVGDRREAGYVYLPEYDMRTIEQRLGGHDRVWIVGYPKQDWAPTPNTSGELAQQLLRTWPTRQRATFGQLEVRLLVRPS